MVLSGFSRKINITDQQIAIVRIGTIECEVIDDDTGEILNEVKFVIHTLQDKLAASIH